MTRTWVGALTALLVAAGASVTAVRAQQRAASGPQDLVGPTTLARHAVPAPADATRLTVTSPAFQPNGGIPEPHSDYSQKISPPLRWTGVPPAAKSLVLLMEDFDAKEPKPFVHWIVYNLPATRQELPPGVAGLPRLPSLDGALQGRGSRGLVGYFGPRPPKEDPAHRYHFQVFALDSTLDLEPGASRAAVLDAMKGRVLTVGELVGTFAAPADAS